MFGKTWVLPFGGGENRSGNTGSSSATPTADRSPSLSLSHTFYWSYTKLCPLFSFDSVCSVFTGQGCRHVSIRNGGEKLRIVGITYTRLINEDGRLFDACDGRKPGRKDKTNETAPDLNFIFNRTSFRGSRIRRSTHVDVCNVFACSLPFCFRLLCYSTKEISRV